MRYALISLALMSATAAVPLAAQDKTIDLRVNKLEKEMKAVQRKVFPGGPQMQPEIGPLDTGDVAAAPATAPLTDLTSRVDALEAQLRMLTGQVETDGNRLRKLEEALKALDMRTDARLKVLEPQPAVSIVETPAPTAVDQMPQFETPAPVIVPQPAPAKPIASSASAATPASAPKPAAPTNSAQRKALIDSIEMPATGDAVEDAYSYGFRLWQAKLYPEAQAKLKEFIAKNPKHKRASYAQNLLGVPILMKVNRHSPLLPFMRITPRTPRATGQQRACIISALRLRGLRNCPMPARSTMNSMKSTAQRPPPTSMAA